jgi:glutaredoxin 3
MAVEPKVGRVRIYTTQWCGYCGAAKRLLEARKIPFEEIDVDNDEARAWLAKVSGRRTVPQIFIGEEAIGGYTDLEKLDRTGELKKKLKAAEITPRA